MVFEFSITYTGTLFHDPIPANAHRHATSYARRPIIPTYQIPYAGLAEYGLDFTQLIHNLAWDFLIDETLEHVCPEAVRLFYSNFRSFGIDTRTFTILVYGHLVTIPIEDLRRLLSIRQVGEILAHESELLLFNFNIEHEFVQLTGHARDALLTLPTTFLLPAIRTFHFFLTHRFLPRTVLLDRVTPLDLWVIQHSVNNVPLDYSHLLFGHLHMFQYFEYHAHLPFGPLLTRLITRLEISLDPFRSTTPSVFLTADNVLDEIAVAIEGEDDSDSDSKEPEEEHAEEEEPNQDIEVHWISSSSSSGSSSDNDDDSGTPLLSDVLADLQDTYGSDSHESD
ncbi:unnamed protein product [Linum trigynum]|uniref:Uncharacterized protein n=1 Tax=Linum trigynum TaxID=586398 RepID=A0AAV2D8Y3_9ROSI